MANPYINEVGSLRPVPLEPQFNNKMNLRPVPFWDNNKINKLRDDIVAGRKPVWGLVDGQTVLVPGNHPEWKRCADACTLRIWSLTSQEEKDAGERWSRKISALWVQYKKWRDLARSESELLDDEDRAMYHKMADDLQAEAVKKELEASHYTTLVSIRSRLGLSAFDEEQIGLPEQRQ